MKKNKKLYFVIMVALLFTFLFGVAAQATGATPTPGSMLGAVNSAKGQNATSGLTQQADQFVGSTVQTVRVIAVLALVIMVLIGGGMLIFGGQKAMLTVKILAIPILLATFMIFKTEAVVATILSLVGQ